MAVMTLMLKDDKEGNKKRAVATGNSSNSVGMSITVSMFLEAVASSVDKAYEVNSSEDLIANIEDVNTKWRMEKVNLVDKQTSTVIEQASNPSEHDGQTERVSEQVIEEAATKRGTTDDKLQIGVSQKNRQEKL